MTLAAWAVLVLGALPTVAASTARTRRRPRADPRRACFQIPLPGGRSVSFDAETGVLRIDVGGGAAGDKYGAVASSPEDRRPDFPPSNARTSEVALRSMEVRDTGTARG
eukprot:CAMPEP_0113551742 /NCGR_PEP_ID=MMETSP0015_2-20120614/14689_1 /TAXON_ID=2838 /ORGANISM="Odontella" /LENGTH=108 /DNA_ID=CAMNT_0000452659 /DNA_START=88 /DNA_END=411 /DNA_ORIENTATION=+ /assembly_acc=CAM_ASM_000160